LVCLNTSLLWSTAHCAPFFKAVAHCKWVVFGCFCTRLLPLQVQELLSHIPSA
jgi:hypothetical protein